MGERDGDVEDGTSMKLRLVLFPLCHQGHLPPMLHLAHMLRARGFLITIVHTGVTSLRVTDHPDFTFIHIPDGISTEEASRLHPITVLSLQLTNCVGPFSNCLDRILREAPEDERVVCLITDALLSFTQIVADSLNLPRMVLRTSSACSFIPLALLYSSDNCYPCDASLLEETVPDLAPVRLKDLPTIDSPDLQKVHTIVNGMMTQTKASVGIIWNTFEELDRLALAEIGMQFEIPSFAIGPFHKQSSGLRVHLREEDDEVLPWLDTQAPNSVVYTSFGSLAVVDSKEFLEMAWGLVNSGRPFLFVVRSDLIRQSEWPEGLPEGFEKGKWGRIVKWAPQKAVLAHPAIGLFCTHAGWNSTVESVSEGVPMICLPSFGDQKSTSRYVAEVWKIGVYVEEAEFRREGIERSIRRVMDGGEEGEEIRWRSAQLKEEARLAVEPGGSSSSSLDDLVRCILSFSRGGNKTP